MVLAGQQIVLTTSVPYGETSNTALETDHL